MAGSNLDRFHQKLLKNVFTASVLGGQHEKIRVDKILKSGKFAGCAFKKGTYKGIPPSSNRETMGGKSPDVAVSQSD